jgi:hypothetical protein
MKDALGALEAAIAAFNGASAVADQLRHAGYRVSSVQFPDLMPAGVRSLAFGELHRFRLALDEMGV